MKVKSILRVGVAALAIVGSSSLSFANGYNDGFLAAESGDYSSAAQQWEPLAKSGHAVAQFNMALLYHSGLGVEQDELKAVSWYHKAADNGYLLAQEYLAAGYQEGWFGLPKDEKQAAYWAQRMEMGK